MRVKKGRIPGYGGFLVVAKRAHVRGVVGVYVEVDEHANSRTATFSLV